MKEPFIQVILGGKTVAVPIYKDEQTTLRIVELVNRRLQDIERDSPRIDTQAFALQAAFAFAVECARAEAAASEDEAELLQSLTRLQLALDEVLRIIDK